MPLNSYLCFGCGRVLELLVIPGSEDQLYCPSCGNPQLSLQTSVLAPPSGPDDPDPAD